jgi:tryptophan-rich sensory protein
VLSWTTAALASVALCAAAAGLEGACAGGNVRGFFQTLRFPRFSAPLWVWSIIGALYYVIFGFVVFRLLSTAPRSALTSAAFALIMVMMFGNAIANLVIFRARNLRLSYVIGWVFALLDVLLFGLVVWFDSVAARALVPYLVYRIYAVWWGRALMKLNPGYSRNAPDR